MTEELFGIREENSKIPVRHTGSTHTVYTHSGRRKPNLGNRIKNQKFSDGI